MKSAAKSVVCQVSRRLKSCAVTGIGTATEVVAQARLLPAALAVSTFQLHDLRGCHGSGRRRNGNTLGGAALAGGRAIAHSQLGLYRPRHLRARAGAHLPGPELALR